MSCILVQCKVLQLICFHWNDASVYRHEHLCPLSLPHSHGYVFWCIMSHSDWTFYKGNDLSKKTLKQRGERVWQNNYQRVQLSEKEMDSLCLNVKTVSSVLWAVASWINLSIKHLMHVYRKWCFVASGYKIVVRRRSCPDDQSRQITHLLQGSACQM